MKKGMFLKSFALSVAMATAATPLMAGILPVYAIEVVTSNGTASLGSGSASITVDANDAAQTLIGKKFEVFKLFFAENSVGGESINYTFNPIYAQALKEVVGPKLTPAKAPAQVTEYEVIDYIQSLNNNYVEGAQASQTLEGRYSEFRYFVEELRTKIKNLNASGDVVTVTSTKADGSFSITGLDYGYYIIDEISDNAGTHSASSLCMVNTANPNASVQVKSDYPSVTKKIKEDDAATGLSVDRWNDIADFEIGQTVPYKFTSNIPNINGYDTYYYAWHDIMDPALTFNRSSVKVSITNGTKTYTLAPNEFTTSENVTVAGATETFVVAIDDIKAIVDREFNNIDNLGHNTYGQTVVLEYDATLNDTAANDTGRPGFENDVRLEFSNDADAAGAGKTGYTPWDTVVCFTYKLNVLKTNNYDLALENAKFRLYSDEDCTNEVYVKRTANGYTVINRDSIGGTDHTGGTAPATAVEMSSAADGKLVIVGLDGGTYYLKETAAPAGYRRILDPIKIEVVPTFRADRDSYVKGDGATANTLMSLEYNATIKQFLSGAYTTDDLSLTTNVDNGEGNLTVINTVGAKLPVTGSMATIILLGAGVALMVGSSKLFGKKEEDCE